MAGRATIARPESSQTMVLDVNTTQQSSPPILRLKCTKPKSAKSVKWNEGTVDNEHMNKKKSKCCCIYKKPKQRFDESSESEEDECDNCFGHVEVKNKKSTNTSSGVASTSEPSSNPEINPPQNFDLFPKS